MDEGGRPDKRRVAACGVPPRRSFLRVSVSPATKERVVETHFSYRGGTEARRVVE